MTDLGLPLAQFVLTACLAGWMLSGVFNNYRFPRLNEASVGMVVRLELMEMTYPDDYAVIKHRRIENPKLIRVLFRLMVLSEIIAAVLLVLGAGAMGLALFGVVPLDVARLLALIGTLSFVANWTGFLIGGEYFCYWYCHFPAQATHLMLTLWGTGVTVLLLMG